MTNDKFIELLNLYLDGELPAEQAASLEREICGSPERHRVYRQYCQMQNACAELSVHFREEAAAAPQFRSGRVVEIPRRAAGDWLRSIGLVTSGAMAACAAFVIVRMAMPGEAPATVANAAPSAPAIAAAPAPISGTTAVAFDSNPAGFLNPWTQSDRLPALNSVGIHQVEPRELAVNVSVPELKYPAGAAGELQPYGKAANTALGVDEIQAAAFQFQR